MAKHWPSACSTRQRQRRRQRAGGGVATHAAGAGRGAGACAARPAGSAGPAPTTGQPLPRRAGLGRSLVVTPDSVNMLSEACAVGCPVSTFCLAPLPAKIERFHQALREAGWLADFAPLEPRRGTTARATLGQQCWRSSPRARCARRTATTARHDACPRMSDRLTLPSTELGEDAAGAGGSDRQADPLRPTSAQLKPQRRCG